jgi:hypothetical protein
MYCGVFRIQIRRFYGQKIKNLTFEQKKSYFIAQNIVNYRYSSFSFQEERPSYLRTL